MKQAMSFHNFDNVAVFLVGAGAGIIKFWYNLDIPLGPLSKIGEAAITAGLCGFAGMAGKWLFGIVKLYVFAPLANYFRKRKK